MNEERANEVRCPVYVKYNRHAKRFALCGRKLSADQLVAHLRAKARERGQRDGHGIESPDVIAFYVERAPDPAWGIAHTYDHGRPRDKGGNNGATSEPNNAIPGETLEEVG